MEFTYSDRGSLSDPGNSDVCLACLQTMWMKKYKPEGRKGVTWPLVTVNLCVSLTGVRAAKPAGRTLLPGVSVGVLEEVSICVGELHRAESLPPCGWASPNQLRTS